MLFPLNVKRVIYVDADQVVRSDLRELWEMDLEGAPYGLTPFCSDEIMNEGADRFLHRLFYLKRTSNYKFRPPLSRYRYKGLPLLG